MKLPTALRAVLPVLLTLVTACGGGHSGGGAGGAAAGPGATVAEPAFIPEEVAVTGHVTAAGTKGPLLLFAYVGAEANPGNAELLSVATIEADGSFAFTVPPIEALTLVFLADGANDGAIDGGDPVAVLTSPALANLQGGAQVTIDEVALNFTTHKATAGGLDVRRSGEALRTPTPVPVAG